MAKAEIVSITNRRKALAGLAGAAAAISAGSVAAKQLSHSDAAVIAVINEFWRLDRLAHSYDENAEYPLAMSMAWHRALERVGEAPAYTLPGIAAKAEVLNYSMDGGMALESPGIVCSLHEDLRRLAGARA